MVDSRAIWKIWANEEVNEEISTTDESLEVELEKSNEILNGPISQIKIENVILNLHNEKANGRDNDSKNT